VTQRPHALIFCRRHHSMGDQPRSGGENNKLPDGNFFRGGPADAKNIARTKAWALMLDPQNLSRAAPNFCTNLGNAFSNFLAPRTLGVTRQGRRCGRTFRRGHRLPLVPLAPRASPQSAAHKKTLEADAHFLLTRRAASSVDFGYSSRVSLDHSGLPFNSAALPAGAVSVGRSHRQRSEIYVRAAGGHVIDDDSASPPGFA